MTSARSLLAAVAAVVFAAAAGAADAADRTLTLTFPSRSVEATFDPAAVRRVPVVFPDGAEMPGDGEAARFRRELGPVAAAVGTGPVLMAVEYAAGDPEARALAYARARALRSRVVARGTGLDADRVVIAALASPKPTSGGRTLVSFVPVALAGASGGADPVRALALDSAYIGPVFADVAPAEAKAEPEATTAAAAPEAEAAAPEAEAAAPKAAAEAAAPKPASEAGRAAKAAPEDRADTADGTAGGRGYTVVWCAPPVRVLDDFYPGGPVVPCPPPGDDR